MAQTIDLRGGYDPSENIVKIINAAAQAKSSQLNLEKEMMLDEIKRKRDLQYKADEQKQTFNMWGDFAKQLDGQSGMANSQTPNQVGSNPAAPIPNWMGESQQPSPMSPQENMQPQVQPQQQDVNQAAPALPANVIPESPIGVPLPPPKGRVTMGASGPTLQQIEPKDTVYNQIYSKWRNGQPISQGEKGFLRDYLGIKDKVSNSPTLENYKNKRTEDLLTTIETNKVRMNMLSDAEQALSNINSGIYGKVSRNFAKNLTPDSPALGDWQKIKMLLTDSQLMYTAKTKGAISDREMDLFRDAAANDDLTNLPRLQPVFKKFADLIEAENKSKINSYKKIYKEDPMEWPEIQEFYSGRSNNTSKENSGSFSYLWE